MPLMHMIRRFLPALLAIWIMPLLLPGSGSRPAHAQEPDPVAKIMSRMSVEDKVGQLFIVPFVGAEANPGSDIWQLVTEYKVGGIILLAANSNFNNDKHFNHNTHRLEYCDPYSHFDFYTHKYT